MIPDWRSKYLSDFNRSLNRLPPERLIDLYKDGKLISMIDRGMATNAAAAGVSVGFFPVILALMFPVLLIAVIALPFFVQWWYSAGAFLAAIIAFRSSRALTTNAVRRRALGDPELLEVLMGNGSMWFESNGAEFELDSDLVQTENTAASPTSVKKTKVAQKDQPEQVPTNTRQASVKRELPSKRLLEQMNEEELRDVWNARPLVQWSPEIQALGQEERWLYFKNHVDLVFWEVPVELLDRVRDRIWGQKEADSSSETPALGTELFQVQQHQLSPDFLGALGFAESHFNGCVQDNAIAWLLSARAGPTIHHLGFRIGNQLFLGHVSVTGRAIENTGESRDALIALCDRAGAHPFILPLEGGGEDWTTVEPEWGIVHAGSGDPLDPFPMVNRGKVIMSDFELQDFAVQIALKELKKTGRSATSAHSSPELDPSIWFDDGSGPAWVLVRVARHPFPNPKPPRNMKQIAEKLAKRSVAGYFASIGVANANDPFIPARPESAYPLYRGEGQVVRFNGLKKIK